MSFLNGEIQMKKIFGNAASKIRAHCFSVVTYYVVSYYKFVNTDPGTDVIIFKLFSPKILPKILAFFAQTTASFCKNLIITLGFEKNANFFAQNWKNRRINCDHNIDPRSTAFPGNRTRTKWRRTNRSRSAALLAEPDS
jgi:hypothetical protein